MPRRSIRILLVVAVVVGLLLLGLVVYQQSGPESPLAVEVDDEKPFTIDPTKHYEINYHAWELPSGDGKGIIIKFGVPTVVRARRDVREESTSYHEEKTASFVIPPDALARIFRAIESHRVMDLHRSYKLRGVTDGPQSKLLIRQGDRFKRVECSNHFPPDLTAFAAELEAIVETYSSKANWTLTKSEPK